MYVKKEFFLKTLYIHVVYKLKAYVRNAIQRKPKRSD